MFAGASKLACDFQVCIRRREDRHRVDAVVRQNRREAVGGRDRETRRERLAPRARRAHGADDLGAVRQVEQALGMRGYRHAEAD
jgi:hypothetical protein